MPVTQEQREFAESLSEVLACWASTYVVLEHVTEFREWLKNRPLLWTMFTDVPSEEAIEGGIEVFIDLSLERATERMLARATRTS